jgi:hypothetical protein
MVQAITRLGAGRPARTASILSSASIPAAVCVTVVSAARYGMRKAFFQVQVPGVDRWLVLEHVRANGGHRSRIERREQVLIADQLAAGRVHDDRSAR